MNNQELKDAERKAGFIDRHSDLYSADPIYKSIIDRTVYLTAYERQKSEAEVGRLYGSAGYGLFRTLSQFETNA